MSFPWFQGRICISPRHSRGFQSGFNQANPWQAPGRLRVGAPAPYLLGASIEPRDIFFECYNSHLYLGIPVPPPLKDSATRLPRTMARSHVSLTPLESTLTQKRGKGLQ